MKLAMRKDYNHNELFGLIKQIEKRGLTINFSEDNDSIFMELLGDTSRINEILLANISFFDKSVYQQLQYKNTSRLYHINDSIIDVCGVKVGGHEKLVFIGGSCYLQNEKQAHEIAFQVKKSGGMIVRGGKYVQRTFNNSFQMLEACELLSMMQVREETALPIVCELLSLDEIDEFVEYIDLILIESRNMQNFPLLRNLGKTNKPILLKRGLSNTIEEWIMAAEYIMNEGNQNVILCDSGIRTFEEYTNNTLDLSVIPIVKKQTHLPIIIDPSTAAGCGKIVESISLAAIAAGADGLMIEVHSETENAISTKMQSIECNRFASIIEKSEEIAYVLGRKYSKSLIFRSV